MRMYILTHARKRSTDNGIFIQQQYGTTNLDRAKKRMKATMIVLGFDTENPEHAHNEFAILKRWDGDGAISFDIPMPRLQNSSELLELRAIDMPAPTPAEAGFPWTLGK